MKQAVFITGFNNWGKTSIIQHLFNGRMNYYQGWTYRINGVNSDFTVETHSNDDYWGQNWSDQVIKRLNNAPANGQNLFTALCPTMHSNNNFVDLLNSPPFDVYDKKHIFLIEYKWEHHAKLLIDNIKREGSRIANANFITIDADSSFTNDLDRFNAKTNQILSELTKLFP
ncbi:MAG: hypothetical protein Q8T03_13455 [Bacteroidota bacterium]|nr:hypothetical protein [Bacteroidota bacterium]MDP3558373.1 hypothetical protein [Bacteroidota bacterium]